MDILPTPTDSMSTLEDVKASLQSLQQYPGGPNVCSSPVSFIDRFQKSSWIQHFPKASFEGNFTYSESFGEKTLMSRTWRVHNFFTHISAVSTNRRWRMRQFDIKTTFLNSNMDRKLYTQEPKGFETRDDNVCLLITALYGFSTKCVSLV